MNRVDLFTTIHKGVRALLFDTSIEAARVDITSNRDVDGLVERIDLMLELLEEHEIVEHAEILPLIELVDRPLADELGRAHDELVAVGGSVDRAARNLVFAPEDARAPHLRELRRVLDTASIKYLSHLTHEETVVNAVLWGAFGDDELLAVHDRIVARLGQERVRQWETILEPVMNPSERPCAVATRVR